MADSPITIQLDEQGAGIASARTQSGPSWLFRTGGGGGMVFSGFGVPDSTVGANGDFYVDLALSPVRMDFYGPRVLGAWSDPFPICACGGGSPGDFDAILLENGSAILTESTDAVGLLLLE